MSEKQKSFLEDQCRISGCRYLQTICATCGRIVVTRTLPPLLQWTFMKDEEPQERDCEILFIAKDGITDERIGIILPDCDRVILKRTDISFSDIKCWMYVPEAPYDTTNPSQPL